jgi:hypothetical protein
LPSYPVDVAPELRAARQRVMEVQAKHQSLLAKAQDLRATRAIAEAADRRKLVEAVAADKPSPPAEQSECAKIDHQVADCLARASIVSEAVGDALRVWEGEMRTAAPDLYAAARSQAEEAIADAVEALRAVDKVTGAAVAAVDHAAALVRASEAGGPYIAVSGEQAPSIERHQDLLYWLQHLRERLAWTPQGAGGAVAS